MTGPSAEAPLFLGIDAGTQSIRAIAFDRTGARVAAARRPTPTIECGGGQAEYDPDVIFQTVLDCLGECAGALGGAPVASIAVASVGESCVPVSAEGRALARAMVWYDRRPTAVAEALAERVGVERIFATAGLPIDPTLTLPKLVWLKENAPEALDHAQTILCMADWIAFRLSGVPATDLTLASRTLLLDMHARCWSAEMAELAGLSVTLPEICPSGTALGPVRRAVLEETGLSGAQKVAEGAHDHVVGSFAAGVTRPGQCLDSMGTAEAILLTTDRARKEPGVAAQGIAQWAVGTDKQMSLLGGSISSSGGSIEWIRAVTGDLPHEELMAAASDVGPGSDGALFMPHLLYAPSPQPDAASRGAFVGLTTHTGRGAMVRAVIEGLAMQAARIVGALAALPGVGWPDEIRIIGGTSRASLPIEIKAAAFGCPVVVVEEPEATALGAALLGGIGAGVWPNLEAALAEAGPPSRTVEPDAAWAECYAKLRDTVFDPLQDALTPTNHKISSQFGAADA